MIIIDQQNILTKVEHQLSLADDESGKFANTNICIRIEKYLYFKLCSPLVPARAFQAT